MEWCSWCAPAPEFKAKAIHRCSSSSSLLPRSRKRPGAGGGGGGGGLSLPSSGRHLFHPCLQRSFQQGKAKFHQDEKFSLPRSPSLVTTACLGSNKNELRSVGTPFKLQTPEGKFLCGILKNHPHNFLAVTSKQLEELATDQDNAVARWELSAGSLESKLHGRIAEMKDLECRISIEEIMYLLVVHNFYEINVPMIPNLSKCTNDGRLEIWSSKEQELESIHEPQMLEMVKEHALNILRWQGKSDTVLNSSAIKIKNLQLSRVYSASIMYGYFLKSVSLRHLLELSLPPFHIPACRFQKQHQREKNLVTVSCLSDTVSSSSRSNSGGGRKAEELRSYMMGFDSKTLQLCAKLRSQEASNLIENHSMALFGDPEKSNGGDNDKVIVVSTSGLKRLVLEAVAFGSFLWDVEKYVDSVYRLKEQ